MGGITKLAIALGLAALALVMAVGLQPTNTVQATAPSIRAAPRADGPFKGIPDLELRYYDVTGSTAEELRVAMDRLRPGDPRTGVRYDGYTQWAIRWHVPGTPAGPCRLDRATVTLDLTVTLPRLVNPAALPPATLARWHRFTAWLEAHEATHARIAVAGREAVLDAIRRADCATAERAAETAMFAIKQRSDEFDQADDGDWDNDARSR